MGSCCHSKHSTELAPESRSLAGTGPSSPPRGWAWLQQAPPGSGWAGRSSAEPLLGCGRCPGTVGSSLGTQGFGNREQRGGRTSTGEALGRIELLEELSVPLARSWSGAGLLPGSARQGGAAVAASRAQQSPARALPGSPSPHLPRSSGLFYNVALTPFISSSECNFSPGKAGLNFHSRIHLSLFSLPPSLPPRPISAKQKPR